MKQDRISGIAIIVGSLMAILIMALHPVGGDLQRDIEYLTRIASAAFWVHVLALVAIAIQAFGFLGLFRLLNPDSALARAGFLSLVIAWIAVFGAAVAGGILPAGIIELYPRLEATEQAAMHVLWGYTSMINQALGTIWVVGTCLGVLFWSALMWPHGTPWKIASVVGLAAGSIGLLSLATGLLRLTVTGAGLFVAGFALWAIIVGGLMCRKT
jgi:hypothetical protein